MATWLRYSTFTLTVICLSGSLCSIAQNVQFRHYSADVGFSGASHKMIVQDSVGFIWVSSNSNPFKFDGYNFISFKSAIHDSLSLPNENLRRIWVDQFGRVWFGFLGRIGFYDRDSDGFITYPIRGIRSESFWCEDENTIWFGTDGHGLYRLDISRKETTVYVNHGGGVLKTQRNKIFEIKDDGETLLIGTTNGLWRFDKKSKIFSRPRCNPADSSVFFNGEVKKIFSHKDHYWIWIAHQFVKVNTDLSVITKLDFKTVREKFDLEKKLTNANIKAIAETRNGEFWMASQGLGLIFYDPATNQLTNYRHDKNDEHSLPSDVLSHVMIDRDENVWATTLPKGIVQLKKQSVIFYNYLKGISTANIALLPSKKSHQLFVGSNGYGLWTGTINPGQLASLNLEKLELGPGFENIVDLYIGKENLWIGSIQGGIASLPINNAGTAVHKRRLFQYSENNVNTISDNFITSFWEGNDILWVGTFSGGLNIIRPGDYGKEQSVVVYKHNPDDAQSILHNGIPDMHMEEDGSLLLGTFGGLERVNNPRVPPDKIEFEHILKEVSINKIHKTSDGTLLLCSKAGLYEGIKEGERYRFTKAPLPGNPFVTFVQEDRMGRLWCMSWEGMFFYDRKNNFVLAFKKEDGLPGSWALSAGNSAQTPDGIMIFSNGEGLTMFDPLSLQINATKPRPVITQLKINNKVVTSSIRNGNEFSIPESINTLKELTLNYTQNILVLEFSAMDFTAPERNLYQYRLEGFDNDWVETDWKNRAATYTNLKPGDYIFKVKASNRDGIWNDYETILKIHVLPPPWKTWWAYSLYGIVLAGILFIARRSIIQRERLNAKLKLEHLELEKVQEIDKAKTNFFANISHEFRTPLTLIQGPVQNLIERFAKDKQANVELNLIQQNAERLLRLVNQILELARLESGSLKKEISEGEILSFLQIVVCSFASLAVQKKISLVQQVPDRVIRARFDKDKLEKIISNLIGNALKFTPENGAIIVNASLENDSTGIQNLFIQVKDTGKGIAPGQMDKIFERFYQVSEDGNQSAGTGIGLALSKELAEFLGGSLNVESIVGEGSRFIVTLPVEVIEITDRKNELNDRPTLIDEARALSDDNNGYDVAMDEKPLLLIVEDHIDLRQFIISCLGDDYQFIEAANGKEGLQQAIHRVPVLVLSDVMMPEMDGIEMCKKIKQDQRTSHIPVILLTAKATDESKLTGLGIGADDYLIKPFNKNELILKIRNHVAARARLQEKIRLEFLSEGTPVEAISMDEKFLEHVRAIIESRLGDEQLSVEILAEEIGMSRVQLYRKITALTGISVLEFIRRLRLQKAAQLLAQNWGPVSQVAYEVGLSNLSHFSKRFKEQYGVLPSEYKRK